MVTYHNLRVNKESLLSIPDHQLHVGKRHIRNDMRVPTPQSDLDLVLPLRDSFRFQRVGLPKHAGHSVARV